MTTTLNDLRKEYPTAEFYCYDRDGREVKNTPWLYAEVADYDYKCYCHVEDGEEWYTEALFIDLA